MEHKHNRELYYNHNLASPEESREKKNLHLPPQSLMAVETLGRWKKKVPKKIIFSWMARLLREDFFAASLL